MSSLHPQDLLWCVRRLHPAVVALLKKYPARVFIAGGYVRACVANETVNDLDLFVSSRSDANSFAHELAGPDRKVHETENAYTVKGFGPPVQFIHRWTFTDPKAAIASFDFTIAMGSFWWDSNEIAAAWRSACHPDFYADLAAKRLVYTSPIRNEDAGGSMLRVLKFYQRGYRIPLDSMGAVIARLMQGVDVEQVDRDATRLGVSTETRLAYVLTGLLREVDPEVDPDHIAHLPSATE